MLANSEAAAAVRRPGRGGARLTTQQQPSRRQGRASQRHRWAAAADDSATAQSSSSSSSPSAHTPGSTRLPQQQQPPHRQHRCRMTNAAAVGPRQPAETAAAATPPAGRKHRNPHRGYPSGGSSSHGGSRDTGACTPSTSAASGCGSPSSSSRCHPPSSTVEPLGARVEAPLFPPLLESSPSSPPPPTTPPALENCYCSSNASYRSTCGSFSSGIAPAGAGQPATEAREPPPPPPPDMSSRSAEFRDTIQQLSARRLQNSTLTAGLPTYYDIQRLRAEGRFPTGDEVQFLAATDGTVTHFNFVAEPHEGVACSANSPRTFDIWMHLYSLNYSGCYSGPPHYGGRERRGSAQAACILPLTGAVVVKGLHGGKGPLLYITTGSTLTYEFLLPEEGPFSYRSYWGPVLSSLAVSVISPLDLFQVQPVRLGQGSFGAVVPAVHWPTGRNLCVKQMLKKDVMGKLSPGQTDSFHTEIDILRQLYHPFIVSFQVAFEEGPYLFTVLERIPGGTVWNYIHNRGVYTEDQARSAITRLLIALMALDIRGILHRDIKPENVLLQDAKDPTSVKLIDFGLATSIDSPRIQMHCGSPGFVAPEIIQRRPYDGRADMFSLGVLLYVMLTAVLPFAARDKSESILTRNERCVYDLTHPNLRHVSHELRHFLQWTLQAEPTRRLSVNQAFMHPWVVGSMPQSGRVSHLVAALNRGTWQSPQLRALTGPITTFHPLITRLPVIFEGAAGGNVLENAALDFGRRISTFVNDAQPLIRAFHAAHRRQMDKLLLEPLAELVLEDWACSSESTTVGSTLSTGSSQANRTTTTSTTAAAAAPAPTRTSRKKSTTTAVHLILRAETPNEDDATASTEQNSGKRGGSSSIQ